MLGIEQSTEFYFSFVVLLEATHRLRYRRNLRIMLSFHIVFKNKHITKI
jgi:hypothetical protein